MTTQLKPLILPKLVEERRKLDDAPTTTTIVSLDNPASTQSFFSVDNTSSSDITSPATPTFSHRGGFGLGHLRCSSSTSSLVELPLASPSFECPASPISAVPNAAVNVLTIPKHAPKRSLPDVQEEDQSDRGEEEDGDLTMLASRMDLYGCLCDEPCTHGDDFLQFSHMQQQDYDAGFLSDSDPHRTFRRSRRGGSISTVTDGGQDSSFSTLTSRFGSRFQALSRWRSTSSRRTYGNLSGAPISEPALSRAPSSRSSSLSSPGRAMLDPPLPLTPSLSYYSSTDSIAIVQPTPTVPSATSAPSAPPAPPAPSAPSAPSAPTALTIITSPALTGPSNGSVPVSPTTTAPPPPPPVGLSSNPTVSTTLDLDQDEVRQSLERDRAMSTTPLLPPLFIDVTQTGSSPLPLSLQSSPMVASPSVGSFSDAVNNNNTLSSNGLGVNRNSSTPVSFEFPSTVPLLASAATTPALASAPFPDVLPSPPLSTKLSVSSFRHPGPSPMVSPMVSPMASPLVGSTPTMAGVPPSFASPSSVTPVTSVSMTSTPVTTVAPTLELQDEWSDRLGHANYTILPKPPLCLDSSLEPMDIERLRTLRSDWSQARSNYSRHLVRVGEHYGATSNTYRLTEEKWTETEACWRRAHESLASAIQETGDKKQCAALSLLQLHDDVTSMMVPIIRDAGGKFPDLGDEEDIVGPMVREEPPAAANHAAAASAAAWTEEKRSSSRFWRKVAGKVGIRKQTM